LNNPQKKKNDLQAEIAEFISGLQYSRLPSNIIEDAKYRVLDWMGSALAGTRYKASIIISEMVRSAMGAAQATLIKGGMKVPVAQAAFANGLIGHVAEYDDGHRLAIGHPGAVTLPASLAVAECYGRTGKELLTAVVAGYEVMIRLGTAINPSHYKAWHTTATCGVFSAAASATSLLKLDSQKINMSLGIAGTMAAGLLETLGTHAKPLNAGHACQSGVQAALLAMNGFTGPDDILLGNKGFIKATSTNYNTKILEEINDGPLLSNTAFYKVYASCGHTNSPLDVIFLLMQEYDIPVMAVKQITIKTYHTAVEMTGQLRHLDEEEAKFSLPYCIAVALLCKRVTLAEFAPERLNDPRIIKLAKKICIVEDTEATKAFPARRATITIEMNDGRVIEKSVKSSSDTPNYQAVEEKFMSLASTCVEQQTADTIRDLILNIEKLVDVNDLMRHVI
jgi:2-methylcitrate dehydratase PrpD